ncbi:hypothetical protein EG327_006845 [Venturia inaequalis]|uniref:Cell wall anchored protein n=1 Tax=Venturia inaequalis TaxID=5025 RepID=A0A8H3UZ02_VENIN|nr:hypothetical protein EG327_006845 [Venturia inaequalis]
MFSILISFTAFLSLVGPSHQDRKDPVRDFCRRFGHATAHIDQRLFVDGGLLNWIPLDQNPNNFSNPYLLYSSLTESQEGMPKQYANLTKPSTVPDVSGGILWADEVNKFFFQFGGEFQGTAQSFDALPYYDALYDRWDTTDTPGDLNRVSFGAGVAVNERAEGYYLGGWMSSSTIPGWTGNPIATANLVRFDMIKRTFNNITGPDLRGRAEGSMVFLPAGDSGLLVYFGGILDPSRNGSMTASPMNTIQIYDILSGKWYTQTATGDVPASRRRFCAGATWPDDHSSYNIYLYGGLGIPPNGTAFDDVYILSLPSFKWIKWWPAKGTKPTASGHHTLTCNVINRTQMLIMGGSFPNTQECDAPNQSGTHNMDLSGNATGLWTLFQPNKTSYNVPPEIIKQIGGGGKGGATLRTPEQGWDSNDLGVYFTRIPSLSIRTATRNIPTATSTSTPKPGTVSSGKKIGTIVGAVLGGLVLLALLLLGCLWILKRIKTKREQREANRPPGELDASTQPTELNTESDIHPFQARDKAGVIAMDLVV